MADDGMRAGEPGEPGETGVNEEERRHRRQRELRSLAQDAVRAEPGDAANPPATPLSPPSPPISRWRRSWIAALVVALCVIMFASLGYVAFIRPAPTNALTPRTISALAAQGDLTCIQDMSVSPDGASVAILGYYRLCPADTPSDYRYQPGQVNVYAIRSGQLIATLHPDNRIASVLQLRPPPGTHPDQPHSDISHAVINYQRIFWSADNGQLALTFSIHTFASATPTYDNPVSITEGALLTDLKAAHSRVLAHTRNPYTNAYGFWNVNTDAFVPIPPNGDQRRPWAPAPPAIGYTWDATGALVPQGPMLATTADAATAPPASAPGAIGSPVGGSSFTIWQPGQVAFFTDPSSGNSSTPIAGFYQFSTDFAIWSPDGARLYTDMNVYDVIIADGHSLPDAKSPLMSRIGAGIPVAPMRDKGLAAALAARANPQFIAETGNGIVLAWRPDGRVLAVAVQPAVVPGKVAPSPAGVDLYDCATGRLLMSLHQQSEANSQNDALLMRWTSDGSRLILPNTATGYFTIWGPDQLPKS